MSERLPDLAITEQLLPYHDRLEQRDTESLDLIVLHCTELPTLEMAREYGERIVLPETQTGFSGHYYIDRDGKIYQYVRDDRVARHVIGHNQNSLGIEVVNLGRFPHWFHATHQTCNEPYPLAQTEAVRLLLQFLKERYPQIVRIARHSDLDTTWIPAADDPQVQIRRKVDPGPLFPWEQISSWWGDLCKAFEHEQRS
jgi:N-acetylmuramoyl-L-alanine amidase